MMEKKQVSKLEKKQIGIKMKLKKTNKSQKEIKTSLLTIYKNLIDKI